MTDHATDPCRTLVQGLRSEDGGSFGCVAIFRPGQKGKGIYHHGITVDEFLSRPSNFGGTWLIDGGWGGPPGPVRVDWVDEESRWTCKGYSAECRDPFQPLPVSNEA